MSWVVHYLGRAEQEVCEGSYEEAMRSGTERHPAVCAGPLRRVRRHVRRQPSDLAAQRWLEGKDEHRPEPCGRMRHA